MRAILSLQRLVMTRTSFPTLHACTVCFVPPTLTRTHAQVWMIADANRSGFLGRDQFVRAMRVIALVQSGGDPSTEELNAAIDGNTLGLAKLDGFDATTGIAPDPFDTAAMQAAAAMAGTAAFGSQFGGFVPVVNHDGPMGASGYGGASNANTKQSSAAPKGRDGKKTMNAKDCTSIIDGLKHIYKTKVRPLEEAFKFGAFYSPLLTDGDFEGKPTVLLLGQYSTGKTTFIKHLLKKDYPGCNIGPEPTTDRFVVVMHGHEPRITPGNTLCVNPDKPYTGLTGFGNSFLSKFEASQCDAKLLEEITIVRR